MGRGTRESRTGNCERVDRLSFVFYDKEVLAGLKRFLGKSDVVFGFDSGDLRSLGARPGDGNAETRKPRGNADSTGQDQATENTDPPARSTESLPAVGLFHERVASRW